MKELMTSRAKTARRLLATLFSVLALAPVAAKAQALTAFTTSTVVLRAGPSISYPHVLVVGGGAPVAVYGCLAGWSWCDVSFQNARGWIDADYLSSPYRGAHVPIPRYGARLGVPVLGFSFNDYWGSYYRDRPWFNHRGHWAPRDHGPYYPPHGPPHQPPHHPDRPPHRPDRPTHGPDRPPHGPDRPPHAGPRSNAQ